jgi:hypothetical protein
VKTLEEIVYEAGRDALADQEALVAGVRQRTGTLLAAHALVASFLSAATIRESGLDAWAGSPSACSSSASPPPESFCNGRGVRA